MSKNKPFFSIITCTLNSGEFVFKNIKSVEKQKFKDYEHIFVDSNSKDNTVKLIKEYKSGSNGRVRLINLPKKGIALAFNKGISKSKGKYLFFLNSDDYLYNNNILSDVYKYLIKNNDLDWFYGKINVVEINGDRVGVFPTKAVFQKSNIYLLKFINFIPHQSVFINRLVFEKFGKFDSRLKLNMDTDLFLRIAKKTKWTFFNKIISNYTLRRGLHSSTNIKNRSVGLQTLELVQSRYLSKIELFFARIVNRLISLVNKTYR